MKFFMSLFKYSQFNLVLSAFIAWLFFYVKESQTPQLRDLYEVCLSFIGQGTLGTLALAGLLGALGVYLSHHTLRNQSLTFKMEALGSKTHRDQLTKLSASLGKDASLLILATRNFLRALKAAGAAMIALPLLDLALGTDPLTVHWSFTVIAGLTGFALAMLIHAIVQLGAVVENRAKTA